ncbi:Tyrosine-protein phosphatase YVH1 [Tolypocladium paradoxum]|uniref:protein-tyrosine-phosphatase n=1 Tax=Tolypocladium paradoxum TaxID=94208 RepID=A0A2S4L4E7_9HYPO|nr:Tyrosine-protein phosphatase YVH1 [Tolypocladium paradoxum]
MVIDVEDVDETDLLVEMPRAVKFIDEGLRGSRNSQDEGAAALQQGVEKMRLGAGERRGSTEGGAVFVHCAAGKSRSIAVTVAYLLWRYPNRFDPNIVPPSSYDLSARAKAPKPQTPLPSAKKRSRGETAQEAVAAALSLVRRTRPLAEPNDGFMEQLALWWEMGCPADVEAHPAYQRWAYRREVEENVAVGQAPSRLRFEDEQHQATGGDAQTADDDACGLSLRCKKCRRTLATAPFIQAHKPPPPSDAASEQLPCPHYFIEPLGWMRGELERGELNGRLACPNERCGAGVGRYDWKGIRCACGGWVTPGLSLQRARVDEEVRRRRPAAAAAGAGGDDDAARRVGMGIRMPPGAGRGGNL